MLVDGQSAGWARDGDELVITPRRPLKDGHRFTVTIRQFIATPKAPDFDDPASVAFFATPTGSATAPQPEGGHYIYALKRPPA